MSIGFQHLLTLETMARANYQRALSYGGAALFLLTVLPVLLIAKPASTANENLPNIIFILADDLGYGDLGCYGQHQIRTPNLDEMAAQGMRFTNAYAGATVCAPSRCVLMTGFHGGHCQVRGNIDATTPGAALRQNDITLAQVLKQAGYTTGIIGKWGLGEEKVNKQALPRQKGFDYFFGYLKQGHAHNYYPNYLWRNESKVELPNVLSAKRGITEKKQVYSQDLFANEALSFIRKNQKQPFFLYLAFTLPHVNNEAGNNGMEIPDLGEYSNKNWPEPEKGYAAMVSRMDSDIGRVLNLLKELKIDENTLVIFASDNGPAREGGRDPSFHNSNGPLRGYKGHVTEGGIRIPFIARWPGQIAPGSTNDSPIGFVDVMATLAKLSGTTAPSDNDGTDFSPTLLSKTQPELEDRFMYWEWNKNGLQQQSARWRNWKALRNPKTKSLELYDLSNDSGEAHDLAAGHPDVVVKFKAYFAKARSESENWPVAVKPARAKKSASQTGKHVSLKAL